MTGWSAKLDSGSADETLAIGRALGGVLAAGDVVALVGALGAGKTHLVKGIADGLGVPDQRLVNSPTFVLINEYEGRVHICHVDAYRLPGADSLEALGFDEMCDGPNVVLIEWADRVRPAVPNRALWIELAVTGESRRELRFRADPATCSLLDRLPPILGPA